MGFVQEIMQMKPINLVLFLNSIGSFFIWWYLTQMFGGSWVVSTIFCLLFCLGYIAHYLKGGMRKKNGSSGLPVIVQIHDALIYLILFPASIFLWLRLDGFFAMIICLFVMIFLSSRAKKSFRVSGQASRIHMSE